MGDSIPFSLKSLVRTVPYLRNILIKIFRGLFIDVVRRCTFGPSSPLRLKVSIGINVISQVKKLFFNTPYVSLKFSHQVIVTLYI